MGYEFEIVHRLAVIIKDVDGISHYVDPLIYQYIITTALLHLEHVVIYPFEYSFDDLIHCNNSLHVTTSSSLLFIFVTTSSIPSTPTHYHTFIKFSNVFNFDSVPIVSHPDLEHYVLPYSTVLILEITRISFY